jgi:hypothetical protein
MKLNIGSAMLLSLALILSTIVIFLTAVYVKYAGHVPAIDPRVSAILIAGAGVLLALCVLYKIYS